MRCTPLAHLLCALAGAAIFALAGYFLWLWMCALMPEIQAWFNDLHRI